MPLTPNFTSSESLSSPNLITFTDTSSGSDVTITGRRIYVVLANGNWLTTGGVESTTEAYITWAIGDVSTTIDLIRQSTVANVNVKWVDSGGVTVEQKTTLTEWNLYDYLFAFELWQSQTATPTIIQDKNYYSNFFIFLTNLWNAENCVSVGNDIYSANAALAKNEYMIDNQSKFF